MDIKYPSNGSKPSIHEGGTKVPSLDASFKKIVGVLLDMGTTHITIPPYNRLVSEAIAKQASATSSSSPSPSTSTASSPPSAQAHDSEAVTPLGKDLGWLLLCFFTQKTKIRVFLQDSVARKVGHILDEQVLRGQEGLYSRPTINDVPELTVALYKIDELHKYQVDGFHTVMWDCFQHAWDAAAGVHAGASALAHAADFLTDTVPPKPLVFGRMRLQIPNSFRYESAFGPVHFGPPSRSLKLFRDTDVPRVFVLPGNLFTSNREEGEAEYPALLNYYMLNSIFTRSEKVHVVGTKAQCEGLRQIYKECVTGPAHDEYFYSDDVNK